MIVNEVCWVILCKQLSLVFLWLFARFFIIMSITMRSKNFLDDVLQSYSCHIAIVFWNTLISNEFKQNLSSWPIKLDILQVLSGLVSVVLVCGL